MGVVNVTPDSFSDGGSWLEPKEGVRHGVRLLEEGADLLDVGGESTRPGADRVPVDEELRRVVPVVSELSSRGALVSVDTMRSDVAAAGLDAGAVLVNDVSGGLADPEMAALVAERAVPYVLMHWRGHSGDMQSLAVYEDVVTDVRRELEQRVEDLLAAGVSTDQLVLDPGLGFAKNAEHNWALLSRLSELESLRLPLLVGASRKRFLGHLLAGGTGDPAPPLERDDATAATSALAAAAGAWCVRVHDVAPTVAAVKVAAAWRAGSARPQQNASPAGNHA
ncbi:MAG: dihydropteroate synthase [Actinomycetes bacterium]